MNSLSMHIVRFIRKIKLFRSKKKLHGRQKFLHWRFIGFSQIQCKLDLLIICEKFMRQERTEPY